MANIVYMPGILGSVLGYRTPLLGLTRVVWLDPTILGTGKLAILQLASDGQSPGPLAGGVRILPLGQWVWSYESLAQWLEKQGHRVLRVAYDWRVSPLSVAASVLGVIDSAYPGQPFRVLAHSMGGLVGRAVYAVMGVRGDQSRMTGLICLGTPHFGSWQAVQMFWRLGAAYQGLFAADLVRSGLRFGLPVSPLDSIIGSWPGVYSLLPWRDSGPLHDTDPALASAMYGLPFWAGGNGSVTDVRLNSAAQEQAALAGVWPPGLTTTIAGVGLATACQWDRGYSLGDERAYRVTEDGDGTVLRADATLPGERTLAVSGSHYGLPENPEVWRRLPSLLS